MKNILIGLLTLAAILVAPDLAAAETATTLIERIKGHLESAGGIFVLVVGFAGAIFAFMGVIGLKKYAEDSRQNPLMKPMIQFLAGSIALGFTAFTGMLSKTTTDADQEDKLFGSGSS